MKKTSARRKHRKFISRGRELIFKNNGFEEAKDFIYSERQKEAYCGRRYEKGIWKENRKVRFHTTDLVTYSVQKYTWKRLAKARVLHHR